MHEALEAIAAFPDLEKMYEFCKQRGIKYNENLPPYLTMASIASAALKDDFWKP